MQAKIAELQNQRSALSKTLREVRGRQGPVRKQLQIEMNKQRAQLEKLQQELGRATDPQAKGDVQKRIDATQEAWEVNEEKLDDLRGEDQDLLDHINNIDKEIDKARFLSLAGRRTPRSWDPTGARRCPRPAGEWRHPQPDGPVGGRPEEPASWRYGCPRKSDAGRR